MDASKRSVTTESGETISYEKLIYALGARVRQHDLPGHSLTAWQHYAQAEETIKWLVPDLSQGVCIPCCMSIACHARHMKVKMISVYSYLPGKSGDQQAGNKVRG